MKCQKEIKEAHLVESMLRGQQTQPVREVVREVVVQTGGIEERRRVQRDLDRVVRADEDGGKAKKMKGPGLIDGARWGMRGVNVPKPGTRLTSGTGHTLDSPPTGEFPGKCAICGKVGHKGVFCPEGVVSTHTGEKQCGALYMYQQGHFNKDGTDAKP